MQTPKTAVQVGNALFFYSITDSLFFVNDNDYNLATNTK
jgi:hypothetical protein